MKQSRNHEKENFERDLHGERRVEEKGEEKGRVEGRWLGSKTRSSFEVGEQG